MKLILSLVVSLLTGSASFGATIAYWRFETGPANAAATGSFSILDSSGNGLHGTPFNNPIYRADVPANPVPQTLATDNFSLDFNGSNQRIYIPDNAKICINA